MKNTLWLLLIGFIVGAIVMYANIQFARTQRTSSTTISVSPTQVPSPTLEPTEQAMTPTGSSLHNATNSATITPLQSFSN